MNPQSHLFSFFNSFSHICAISQPAGNVELCIKQLIMKTIKTENRNKEFAPGFNSGRGKFLNQRQGKTLLLAAILMLFFQITFKVKAEKNQWQYTISSGVHSFYAPVENLKWDNPAFAVSAGVNRLFGAKQILSLGLQADFAANEIQENATSLQLLGQITPVLFKKLELGFGTGAGYRFSGYPSDPLKWNGTSWENGKKFKGIVQIPVQLSAGFRSVKVSNLEIIPFVAYQMKAMFGYNPDFDPLPDSQIMFGFKFRFN